MDLYADLERQDMNKCRLDGQMQDGGKGQEQGRVAQLGQGQGRIQRKKAPLANGKT